MEIIQFYPFLQSLPSSIKPKIDWEELYIPDSYEVLLMNELTECLNKHIILYKKDYHHKLNILLSSTIVSAKLNSWQITILKNYEKKFSEFCNIAAYNNPLQLAEFSFVEFQNNLQFKQQP
jgi:hypothetical protein